MGSDTTAAQAAGAGTKPSLGAVAVRGAAWMSAATLATRVLAFVTQTVLTYLLVPADFGMWREALTLVSMVGTLKQNGLDVSLLSRKGDFERYAPTVQTLSMSVGVIGLLVIAAGAPLAERFFGTEGLMWVVLGAAVLPLLQSARVVPNVTLQANMRFPALAGASTLSELIRMAVAVIAAALGAGPYALLLALLSQTATNLGAEIIMAKRFGPWRPSLKHLRELLSESWRYLLTSMSGMVSQQTAFIVLGRLFTEASTGLFAVAFGLSLQAVQGLVMSLTAVLLPTVNQIGTVDEPERRRERFAKILPLLCVAVLPINAFIAVNSELFVKTLLAEEFHGIWPALALLSLAAGLRAVSSLSGVVLKSLRKFGLMLRLQLISTAAMVSCVVGAAVLGPEADGESGPMGPVISVCAGVLVQTVLLTPWRVMFAIGEDVRALARATRIVVGFFLLTLLPYLTAAVGFGYVADVLDITESRVLSAALLVSNGLMGTLGLMLVMRVFCPTVLRELVQRLRQLKR